MKLITIKRHLRGMIAVLLTILAIGGCGTVDTTESGGDGGATPPGRGPSPTLLEGRVADGYLSGARVFLDRNGNKRPDPDEPQTETGSGGRFSLAVAAGEATLYPVVVEVVAGRTIDEDDFQGVSLGYTLETPIGRQAFISPLTTLVKQELDKNKAYRATDAETLVRTRFGLADDISLWQDYMAQGGDSAHRERAHRTAKVLARFNGRLLEGFRQNLDGSIAAEDYPLATLVVGDLEMKYAGEIALALTGLEPLGLSDGEAIDRILAKIDLAGLTKGLLQQYRRLLAEQPDVWDATPPAITAHSPEVNAAVPVTTTITVTFDEVLDPASIGSDAIVLSGGGRIFSGQVSYDAALRQLTMIPDAALFSYTDFTVSLAPALSDLGGNPLGEGKSWMFSTIFDRQPPALPSF